MKNLNLIIWITQLGLSIVFPLAGFTLFAVWLKQRFALGIWIVLLGVAIGIISAVDSFRLSLKTMERMSCVKSSKQEPPPVSFNDHQ